MLTALAEHTSTGYKITKEWTVEPNTAFELNARNQNFKIEIWDKKHYEEELKFDDEEFSKMAEELMGNKNLNNNQSNGEGNDE